MTGIPVEQHIPRFDGVLCGDLTDRQRLGLPNHYQRDRFANGLSEEYQALRSSPPAHLLALLSLECEPLLRRYAAGNLLALCRDPRLNTFSPDMVCIDGATTSIGLPRSEMGGVLSRFAGLGLDAAWIEKECPRHTVTLGGFRLARYPVTNQEYRDFLVDTGDSEIPTSWSFRRFPMERANHPVYSLPAPACDRYASWLAAKTGRRFRLPSEYEWEYAAGGSQGNEFPWGSEFDATLANTCETGIFDTTPVGIFPGGASPFGVLDMAGNVEEYVSDTYAPYPGGAAIRDHLAVLHGEYRVARGGSFARFRDLARTRRRHGHNPRSATYVMGFRLAESV